MMKRTSDESPVQGEVGHSHKVQRPRWPKPWEFLEQGESVSSATSESRGFGSLDLARTFSISMLGHVEVWLPEQAYTRTCKALTCHLSDIFLCQD